MWKGAAKNCVLLVALVLLLLISAACNRSNEEAQGSEDSSAETKEDNGEEKSGEDGEEEEDKAVPVEVVTLGTGQIEAVLRFSTNLEAERGVQVFSEAERQVRQLLVEEGDEVRRGQVLVRLQDEEQRTAMARVESQLAKAKREYERQTNLFEQKLISEQIYYDATYDLEQLDLALQDAKRQLGYTEVRAPISGTVTERFVNVGDHLILNQRLFDLVDFDSIVARVYVPEKELSSLRVGQDARVFAEAAGGTERFGTVDRIAPRVDPRSGTVKATIKIPRNQELLPGMYVSVELITEVHADAVLVPKKALVYDADQIFVFRMKSENRVERLLIESALEDRDNIEPAGVLEVGDRIVVAGQAGLKDDTEVRLINAAKLGSGHDEPSTELEPEKVAEGAAG